MIANSKIRPGPSHWKLQAPVFALLLWALLWVNLNSSFLNLVVPHSLDEWQLLIRAIFPLIVLPVALSLVFSHQKLDLPDLSPSRLLMGYGLLTTISSIASPQPGIALYWCAAFLATIATAWTFATARSPVLSTRQMLQVTWAGMLAVAAIQVYMGRAVIFGGAPSGYLVNLDLSVQAQSAGVARWAAVPGLVCLIKAYHTRRPALVAVFLSVAGAALYVVYRLQSRGAIFGSVAALLFAMVTSSRMRRYALPVVLVGALAIPLMTPTAELSGRVMEYLKRGETDEGFLSMDGRTALYENGLAAFGDAPLLGRGQWADRLVNVGHVHNSYIQALLNGGVIGIIPYLASWIAGWVLFFRLQKRRRLLRPEDQTALLEVGAVMMFFTVRSMPETTTASFAVDLLVMAAIYVYLEILAASVARRSLVRTVRRTARASEPKAVWCPQIVSPSPIVPYASSNEQAHQEI